MVAALALSTSPVVLLARQNSALAGGAPSDAISPVLWVVIYGAALLFAHARGLAVLRLVFRSWLIVAIMLLAVLSSAWSADPRLTLHRSLVLCLSTFFGAYMALRLSPAALLRLLAIVLLGLLAVSVVLAVGLPAYGIDHVNGTGYDWRGVFATKNSLGRFAALSTLVWSIEWWRGFRRLVSAAAVMVSLASLYGSNSRTSMAVCVLLLVFISTVPLLRARSYLAPAAVSFLALILMSVSYWFVQHVNLVLQSVGATGNLTGRTAIWNVVWVMIKKHVMWGYGYGAFWRGFTGPSGVVWDILDYKTPHSHNAFLDVWLELGAVGVILVVTLLVLGVARGWQYMRMTQDRTGAWPIVFVLFVFFSNLTESGLTAGNSLSWIVLVAIVNQTSLPKSELAAADDHAMSYVLGG